MYREGSAVTDDPTDGANYSIGNTIGSSKVGAIISSTSDTLVWVENLTMNTNYHFKIFPFNWDGSDITTANYYIGGSPKTLSINTIPTLGEWAMIIFMSLMAIGGVYYSKKYIS